MSTKIPVWIMIWGFFMALIPLGFGLLGYFNADSFFAGALTTSGSAIFGGPAGAYVGRNMAAGITTFFALSQRSASMLILAFVLRIVTDVFDLLNATIGGTLNGTLVFFAALLMGGSAFAIFKLWGLRTGS